MSAPSSIDSEIEAVIAEYKRKDPQGSRSATVLRDTIDQLYDGPHTGRYSWSQLFKTEKTHCGTLVEINLHREFKFHNGAKLDYCIAGIEVDCKYSQTFGAWMIPPEAIGEICMLVWAEDTAKPKWSLGFVRITEAHLSAGVNRDRKCTLNASGRRAVTWLFRDEPLPPNILLQLDETVVAAIMALPRGQPRVNALFRAALGMIVRRQVIETLANRGDAMKRVRYNGGARTHLRPEGIIILGQFRNHQEIARLLGVPVPGKGEFIAVRVSPANAAELRVATIDGGLWKIAGPSDPPTIAPKLPKV